MEKIIKNEGITAEEETNTTINANEEEIIMSEKSKGTVEEATVVETEAITELDSNYQVKEWVENVGVGCVEIIDATESEDSFQIALVEKKHNFFRTHKFDAFIEGSESIFAGMKAKGLKFDDTALFDKIYSVKGAAEDNVFCQQHNKLGWTKYKGECVFLWDRAYSADDTFSKYVGDNISMNGDLSIYTDCLRRCLRKSTALLAIYAVGASGIVNQRLTSADSLTVNVTGESSIGKTTALKLAYSFGKNPIEIDSFVDTTNAIDQHRAENIFLPTVADELLGNLHEDSAKSKQKLISSFVFGNSTGKSKSRLYKDGSVYFGSLLTSSEKSLFSMMKADSSKGQMYRIIEFYVENKDLFNSGKEAIHVQNVFYENYGIAAPVMARYILKENLDLNKMVADWCESYSDKVEPRIARKLALITVTADILIKCFGIEANLGKLTEYLVKQINRSFSRIDPFKNKYVHFCECIADMRVKNRELTVVGRSNYQFDKHLVALERSPSGDVLVYIIKDNLDLLINGTSSFYTTKCEADDSSNEEEIIDRILMKGKDIKKPRVSVDDVIKRWDELGVIIKNSGRYTRKVQLGNQAEVPTYCIKYGCEV